MAVAIMIAMMIAIVIAMVMGIMMVLVMEVAKPVVIGMTTITLTRATPRARHSECILIFL